MKKKYYRLTKNGILLGEFEEPKAAFVRGEELEGSPLSWRDMTEDSYFAFGRVVRDSRTEYEVVPVGGKRSR